MLASEAEFIKARLYDIQWSKSKGVDREEISRQTVNAIKNYINKRKEPLICEYQGADMCANLADALYVNDVIGKIPICTRCINLHHPGRIIPLPEGYRP